MEDTPSEAKSNHTVELYSDVSDDEFTDCNTEFMQEVNQLERKYFESLHVENVESNVNFVDSPVLVHQKVLIDFEEKHFHCHNVTPNRPCSAFFKTDSLMPVSEIFDALEKDGFHSEHIRCLQRNPTGEIFITFHMSELCDTFLSKSSFVTPGCSYAPNDSERPLTFLTVYDTPYELPETAIIHRLSPYCKAVWHHWGTYKNQDGVFNGLQHFRVRIQFAVPSYLCFGKFLLHLYHDGQTWTCRRCNRSGRKAADCRKSVSFNCDALGHMARECIRPMYCCICKSGQHLARTCPFSWHREKDTRHGDTPASEHGTEYGDFRHLLPNDDLSDQQLLSEGNSDPPPEDPGTPAEENHTEQNIEQSTEQNTDEVPTPKLPAVVDPESVLAEQMELAEEMREHLRKTNDTPDLESNMSPTPPRDLPAINSEGFLTEHQPSPVARTTRNPAPILSTPEMESVERSNVPASEKSWADVVDATVPPVGPSQKGERPHV